MAVWDDLVGQDRVTEQLAAAARDAHGYVATAASGEEPELSGSAMTHAWLFTGPPGSGRSTAARAFAAPCSASAPTSRWAVGPAAASATAATPPSSARTPTSR